MTKRLEACCSSPAAMGYWFTVSLVAWGVLSLIGFFFALCTRPRRLPFCDGHRLPRQLVPESLISLRYYRPNIFDRWHSVPALRRTPIKVKDAWVWPFVLVGTLIAFLLEWRYARRRAS
jgi:hypothetical protein